MKKLKKVLSLVLVLAMCVSAFGVSAFAANYDDYKDADTVKTDYAANETAIDVVTGLKIINGDGGYLNLGNGLTRAEAAKILTVVDLGTKTADSVKSSTVSTGYTDMKGHWASGFVAYCTRQNYLAGNGDGTFDPEGDLTGYAFGKMMLNVLGYGLSVRTVNGTQIVENKYTGDLWEINVLADGIAIDLFKDVKSDLAGKLTRADAMQMTYNALLKAGKTAPTDANYGFYSVAKELKIVAVPSTDAGTNEGRPTYTVKAGDKVLTSYAAKPDYTFTAKAPGTDADSINKELGKKGPDALVFAGTAAYENAKRGAYDVAAGDEVEIYMAPASKTDIAYIVTTHYELAKVADIVPLTVRELNKNATSDDPAIKNAKSKVTLDFTVGGIDDLTLYETQIADFDYEKDQYVLVAVKDGNTAVLASSAAETVSGKVTATKAPKVAIDGTYYECADGVVPEINDEGTWALDKAGKLGAEINVVEESSEYALVYNVTADRSRDADGKPSYTYTLYIVKPDGTKASYPVENGPGSTNLRDLRINVSVIDAPTVPTYAVAYTLNDKGEIVYAAAKDKIVYATTNLLNKDNASIAYDPGAGTAYATADSTFIFVPTTGPDAYKPSVVNGYKDVKISTSVNVKLVVDVPSNNVIYAFVLGANGSATSNDKYAVVLDETPVVTKDPAGHSVFTYSVAVNGEETTISTDTEISSVAEGDILTYTVTDGIANVTAKVSAGENYTVNAATSDYVVINSNQYGVSDKTEVYKIVKFEKAPGEVGYEVEAVSGVASTDKLAAFFPGPAPTDLSVAFIFVDETPEP